MDGKVIVVLYCCVLCLTNEDVDSRMSEVVSTHCQHLATRTFHQVTTVSTLISCPSAFSR